MRVMVSDGRGRRVRHLVVQAPPGARCSELAARAPVDPGRATTMPDGPLRHGEELWPGTEVARSVVGHAAAGPWVVVAAGPDAGTALPLRPGLWVSVGRDPACGLSLEDPSLSRRHVRIRLARESVLVEDLGSTNGMSWESGSEGSVWKVGDRLLIGGSTLVLLPRMPAPASVVERDGHGEIVPWTRSLPAPAPVELSSPTLPAPRVVRRPSVWTWALPLGVAVVVAAVLQMPWLLLFGLLGPAMVFGHHLGDRRAARDEHREALAAHRQGCADVRAAAGAALAAELAGLREAHPGLVGVARAIAPCPTIQLWEVGDEPLTAVLGEAPAAADVMVDGAWLVHDRAPLVVEIGPPLALVGPPALRDALLRSVLLQLATRHPPGTFALEVDPGRPPGEAWDLLAWLPHTRLGGGGSTEGVVRWGTDIVLVDDVRDVPPGMPRVLVQDHSLAVLQRPGMPDQPFRPTLLGLAPARRLARSLSPLRIAAGDAHDPSAPAGEAPLGTLLRWPHRSQEADPWGPPTLTVPLGRGADGSPVLIDLAADGPHALVAGTTGSGKSELLRTLVVGLALQNSPADLTLLLIDYKGGSSLGACTSLPHVTGLVTDLDPHLAERVLLSLQSELGRRERILQAAGARDIRDHDGPGLPRLVVVIDEFRVLAEEVPQVMEGLVRVAAVGRSLGVHLVLATQRPAGVVGADLRANVNLRIALRVRDSADSYDVLECADAAHLPEGRPGLALLRTGASAPRSVQVAVARPEPQDRDDTDGWQISEHPDVWSARLALDRPARTADDEADDPVEVLGSTLSASAEQLGQQAERVWLPPLGEDLRTDPGHPSAWAVADLPAEQRQTPLVWTGDHHLGIVGAARSGRSTALRSLLARSDAWTVVLDLGRSLSDGPTTPSDPRCCAWVTPDDRAHALRVLDLLLALVQDRQADPSAPREPVVLAVDGWDRLVDHLGQVEAGRGVELVQRILREGPGVGVVGLLTGDRSLLLGTMATLLPQTWMLHLNDPSDLMLTGLRAAQVPRHQPPGRMIRAGDGVVAQVVQPDPSPSAPGLTRPADPGPVPPLLCLPLPRRWDTQDRLSWAVGGDQAHGMDLPPGPVLVLGGPGSGRTQALQALAAAAGGPALRVDGTDPPTEEQLAESLAGLPGTALVSVDDAHLLSGTRIEDLLVDHAVRHGPRVALHVVAELDGAATAFRGLLPQLARARTAVVLQPGMPGDGAVVGAQLPVGDLRLPGRGVLVHRGRTTRIQVAAPAPDPAPAPSTRATAATSPTP